MAEAQEAVSMQRACIDERKTKDFFRYADGGGFEEVLFEIVTDDELFADDGFEVTQTTADERVNECFCDV